MTVTIRMFLAALAFQRDNDKQPNRLRLSPQDYNNLRAEVLAEEARLAVTDDREEWMRTGVQMRVVVDPAATELSVYWEEE